ncbi:LysM peptidoglycan-binding domain-containing protein [Nostocoides sp. F2B08]|uniref:LysM peptidoglycan-binding domain-containing protein n=1 Tax=Nostocoides sp. F2B08 TaxID=2653936 RepID=UPI001D042090|nr:LysM peptidoglycan-binding domain-containing protein [Tetrasphaera sp. F2B08]
MHSSSESPHPVRGVVVLLSVALAALGSGWALAIVVRDTLGALRSPGRVSVDELVVATSATCALGILLWVALGLVLSVLAALPGPLFVGDRLLDAVAPAAVRRWAGLLLGVSVLTAGLPGAAMAHESLTRTSVGAAGSAGPWSTAQGATAPEPIWVQPDPEAHTPAPAPGWTPTPVRALPSVTLTAPRTTDAERETRSVTVRRGDTLWDLAAAHLATDATDAEIADEWQRWFQANRRVIGPDPDLLLPGQVLQVPGSTVSGGSR